MSIWSLSKRWLEPKYIIIQKIAKKLMTNMYLLKKKLTIASTANKDRKVIEDLED